MFDTMKLRGYGAPNFSNSSKTRAKPTTHQTISWLGLAPPGVVCHLEFGSSSGEHGGSERAHC